MMKIKNGFFLLLFSLVFHMGCSSSQDIKTLEEETQADAPFNALDEDLTQEEFQNAPEEFAEDSKEDVADEVNEEDGLDDGEESSPEEEYLAQEDSLSEDESLEEDEELPSGVLGEVVEDEGEEDINDENVTDELASYAEEEGEDIADIMEDESDQLDASFEAEESLGEMNEVASNNLSDFSDGGSIGEAGGKKYISVKKIKTIPYSRQGKIINTVYIIREKDTPASVAQKIYGDSSRSKDLFLINPHLNRSFKIGDKIYYDSVKRPGDTSRIMTYYEDHGIPPQNYISKPGENIRGIASSLFGNREYWKELWATNLDIQSKWGLKAGTSLNYWPQGAGGSPVQQIAQNTPPVMMDPPPPPPVNVPSPVNDMPPPMDDMPPPVADIPPPPMDDMDIPPPPPPMDDTLPPPILGNVDELPPPPPPSGEPSEFMVKGDEQGKSQGLIIPGLNKDQTMMVLAGAILFFGLGIIVLIKKREKKRLRSTQTQTQI